MILVNSHVYDTIIDFAENVGVSSKTIRDYMRKGIIPKPPEIRYGVRTVKYFPAKYMKDAKVSLEVYRKNRELNKCHNSCSSVS